MHIERLILPLVIVLLAAGPSLRAQTTITMPIEAPLPYGGRVLNLPVPQPRNETSARVVEMLLAELTRPDQLRERRAELAADLVLTRRPEARAALASIAGDADPIVRATVAEALGSLEGQDDGTAAAAALVPLAADVDPTVRAAAVRSAGALQRGDLVTAGLNDADAVVVAAALSVATADQAAGITARLTDEDEPTRVRAIEAAGRAGVTASADAVAAALASDSIPVQVAALRALSQLKATAQAGRVTGALTHDHPTVRRAAVAALVGVLGPDDARARGIAMLRDPDESVRTGAAELLALVPGPVAIEPLVAQLPDPYTPLHAAARAALVAIGEPITDAAVRLLDHPDARRREDGSYLLGGLRSRAAFARHVALADDADWPLVGQVARSLGRIGDPAAGPALVTVIERGTVEGAAANQLSAMRAAAADAIRAATTLGHVPTGAAVARFVPQTAMSSDVRSAAVWAVGMLGAPDEDAIFAQFPRIIDDMEESGEVKLEAVKAIGNRRHLKSADTLAGGGQMLSSGEMAALAHWAGDRLKGQATPFTIAPTSFRADVSINDLSR